MATGLDALETAASGQAPDGLDLLEHAARRTTLKKEKKKQAGLVASLPQVPEQLLRFLASAGGPEAMANAAGQAGLNVVEAAGGDVEAQKAVRARGLATTVATAAFPGGVGLAGRAALGAATGGAGSAIEAGATGQEVGPAAVQGAVVGAILNPLLGGAGDIVQRAMLKRATKGIAEEAAPAVAEVASTPVDRVIQALRKAPNLRGQQEKIYRGIRSKQAGELQKIGGQKLGEAGLGAKLGALKGSLPKVDFESIREALNPGDIDALFNQIEVHPGLGAFDRVHAAEGLAKIMGQAAGALPTRSEISVLDDIFGKQFTEALLSKRGALAQAWDMGLRVANVPRELMASFDLSAPLRQGLFSIGRTKQFASAFGNMFRYFGSNKAYQALQEDIARRPTAALMRRGGLALTDIGGIAGKREEAFAAGLAEKIPIVGAGVRASERAYTGFLTKLRADVFDDMLRNSMRRGFSAEEAAKPIAEHINNATGRGNLGKLQQSTLLLNSMFWSPRLIASRVNLLNPLYYATRHPAVRREAIRDLLSFTAMAGTTLGLAKLGGAHVNTDPRSADFAKIRIGNTRYDTLGGFQQYIRLAGQLVSGEKTSVYTGETKSLTSGKFGAPTRLDVAQGFVSGKLAPVPAFVYGWLKGRDATGKEFKVPEQVAQRFIPLALQDVHAVMQEWGNGRGALMGSPAIFGVGVQNYPAPADVTARPKLNTPENGLDLLERAASGAR